jgi:hypothetical protein
LRRVQAEHHTATINDFCDKRTTLHVAVAHARRRLRTSCQRARFG